MRSLINMNNEDLLKLALEYHKLGWSIIPIPYRKKKPPALKSWKPYQVKRAGEDTIRKWISNEPKNIAVVFGKASGGLACRDFDSEQSYHNWAKEHPELAAILPTVRTSRGYHVYFKSYVEAIKTFDDGEYRGKGYCLLPPSIHPSNAVYQWVIKPNGEIPKLTLQQFGIDDFTEEKEELEETEDTEDSEAIKGGVVVYENLNSKLQDYVNNAIACTLPNKEGYRNFLIFQFCRELKGCSEFEKYKAGQLKPLVKRWYEQALPIIGTKSFDETWADFCYGWPRVKYPKGSEVLKIAVKNAMNGKTILEAENNYETPEIKLLVRICYELQKLQQNEPFWLSEKDGAKILGVSKPTIGKWLAMFEADGIIKKVKEYTSKEATRYKFIAK